MKPGDNPTTEELREALMKAVEVARAGQKEKPPIDPPARLKPVLGFARFPEQALGQVRATLETDDEFRTRVVASIAEDDVGLVGWLWLSRPDGWEQEYAELASSAEQASEEVAGAASVDELTRSLRRSETAQSKLERQRNKAIQERDEARKQAAQARSEARQADEVTDRLADELEKAKAELASAIKLADRSERKQTRSNQKLKKSEREIDRLSKELRDSRQQHEEEVGGLKERLAAAEGEVAMAREAGFELPSAPEPEPPAPLTKRIPVAMPSGLLHDTPEAVEHLLRMVPDVVVLVDGYNVTFKNWEKLSVRDQRQRFLQKMEELSARYTGAEFVVVFDGSETDYDYISTTARSLGVTVRFSQPGVTADDYIINQCESYPLSRQLVVVSEDGEVRERARDRGANLVHPRKLLEIMGLEVEYPDGWMGFGDR